MRGEPRPMRHPVKAAKEWHAARKEAKKPTTERPAAPHTPVPKPEDAKPVSEVSAAAASVPLGEGKKLSYKDTEWTVKVVSGDTEGSRRILLEDKKGNRETVQEETLRNAFESGDAQPVVGPITLKNGEQIIDPETGEILTIKSREKDEETKKEVITIESSEVDPDDPDGKPKVSKYTESELREKIAERRMTVVEKEQGVRTEEEQAALEALYAAAEMDTKNGTRAVFGALRRFIKTKSEGWASGFKVESQKIEKKILAKVDSGKELSSKDRLDLALSSDLELMAVVARRDEKFQQSFKRHRDTLLEGERNLEKLTDPNFIAGIEAQATDLASRELEIQDVKIKELREKRAKGVYVTEDGKEIDVKSGFADINAAAKQLGSEARTTGDTPLRHVLDELSTAAQNKDPKSKDELFAYFKGDETMDPDARDMATRYIKFLRASNKGKELSKKGARFAAIVGVLLALFTYLAAKASKGGQSQGAYA